MGQTGHGPKLLFWWHFEKFPALFIDLRSEQGAHPVVGTQLDLNAATSQPGTCSPPSPASFFQICFGQRNWHICSGCQYWC